jgi:hypothetical protein
MKFKIEISGVTFLFGPTEIERLIDLIADGEMLTTKWKGAGKPNVTEIEPVDCGNLKLTPMPQAEYDTLKLATKLNSEN